MADEIVQVLRGRSFRDTLFGKVRYGQAIMQNSRGERREVAVVIKEYDRDLVERRMTKNGEQVGEDAKEELRIHSLLCQASSTQQPPTSPPTFPSTGHPHIVHLFDVRKDDRFYYAILEFCARGEFFPLVQHSDFTPLYARHYFRQLMAGLAYMHSHHIAHRDLSLENILLDDKGDLKICDLGVAVQCNDVNALIRDVGVPVGKVKFYMPPEVFGRQMYSPAKVDVWTAGIILFVMLTKVHPFKYATAADQRFVMVFQGQASELLRRWGKEPLHPHADDLLRRILCPMEQRLSVAQVLAHPYCSYTDAVSRPIAVAEERRDDVDGRNAQQRAAQPQQQPIPQLQQQQQQQPPQQRELSHYEAATSHLPPTAAMSPTSPSFNMPNVPQSYGTPPLAISQVPTYPAPASAHSAAVVAPAAARPAYPAYPAPSSSVVSASSASVQQQPRIPLQQASPHPLAAPPPSHSVLQTPPLQYAAPIAKPVVAHGHTGTAPPTTTYYQQHSAPYQQQPAPQQPSQQQQRQAAAARYSTHGVMES